MYFVKSPDMKEKERDQLALGSSEVRDLTIILIGSILALVLGA